MQDRAIKCASAAFFITSLALASDTWILDASTSNARLFHGPRANSELGSPGLARVAGKVKLDANDLNASFFDLSIYPADEDWGHELIPETALRTRYVPDTVDQTRLTFKSTRIVRTRNGHLEVLGDLTLIRVERAVIATPTEDDAGPRYGDPVIHNETRKITFLFPSASAEHVSGPSTSAMLQGRRVLEIVGSARVQVEEFPELLNLTRETNRPAVEQNNNCYMPSTVGEKYSAAPCPGTVVAATRDNNCDVPASAGKDYSGPQRSPSASNQTTIVLDLKFLHPVPEPSVGLFLERAESR
jgi:polyisoprenoid-binding protein YceI